MIKVSRGPRDAHNAPLLRLPEVKQTKRWRELLCVRPPFMTPDIG
jgi:hypothetical protein